MTTKTDEIVKVSRIKQNSALYISFIKSLFYALLIIRLIATEWVIESQFSIRNLTIYIAILSGIVIINSIELIKRIQLKTILIIENVYEIFMMVVMVYSFAFMTTFSNGYTQFLNAFLAVGIFLLLALMVIALFSSKRGILQMPNRNSTLITFSIALISFTMFKKTYLLLMISHLIN